MQSRALPARNGSTPISISRLGVLAASFVCKRRQHKVAGKRGFNGDSGRFPVPYLPHEDDVGVRPQDGTQRSGEGKARPSC